MTKTMLALAIAGAFSFPSTSHSSEWRWEALGGTCKYSAVGDGIWYNSKYPHHIDLSSTCGFIGASKIVAGRGWRIGYASLGTARITGRYPVVDAEQALPAFTSKHCNITTWSGCIAEGKAVQSAKGISTGYVVETSKGNNNLGIEGGLFLYDGSFTVDLRPVGNYQASWMDKPIHWRGIQLSPYAGVTWRNGILTASARYYGNIRAAEHGCGYCSGLASGGLTQYMIGLSSAF